MRRIERVSRGIVRPGQTLIVAGYAGLAGSCRIARERPEELMRWFSAGFIKNHQNTLLTAEDESACRDWRAMGADEWEEAGEGGVYAALWNLSGAYMAGFSVDLRRIPVKQATVEICERYGLNPYRLLSDGCTVLAAGDGLGLLKRLEGHGIAAAAVGVVREGIVREIIYGSVRGFMERPREDEILRLGRHI